MQVTLELETLSILSGDEKIALEDYVDICMFRRRKQFNEWIVHGKVEIDLELNDLMILAKSFIVEVCSDGIALKNTN